MGAAALDVPFAERAGCVVTEPGVAVMPRSPEGLNASNTINGGLLALAAEEAVLSLSPGATLASMGIRYLRPARVGPAVAAATVRNGLGIVEVRDAGTDNRLAVLVTTRIFDPTVDGAGGRDPGETDGGGERRETDGGETDGHTT
jgi:acyl-coenzyme A thioesterase PaaI-like protein